MKASILYAVVALGLWGVTGTAKAQDAAYWNGGSGNHFTCESHDGRYRECRVDTRGRQSVRLVRQLSRAACIEGRTWGSNYNGVWVNGGCRAEFVVNTSYGYGRDRDWRDRDGNWRGNNRWGSGYGGTVLCESPRSNHNRCAIDTSRGVTLVRQISSTRCREGHNWGVGHGEIWVDHGCRAEFAPRGYGYGNNRGNNYRGGYNNGYGYGNNSYGYGPQLIHCASNDGRQNHCRVNIPRGVELTRQLSRSSCIQGRTWGWDRSGIWVSDGCRAEFRVW